MDFWKTILGLARRKAVGLPTLVLAVGLGFAAFYFVPATYVTSASMVLVTPSGGGSIDRTKPIAQTNPLLQFTDDLRTTASILILAMNTTDVFKSLGVTESGPTVLTIDDGRSNPQLLGVGTTGPFIYAQVESNSAATARSVLVGAQQRIRDELEGRQRELKAHPVTFVQVEDVVLLRPESDLSAKWQAAGGGVLAGLVVGFGLAYAVVRRRLLKPAVAAPIAVEEPAVAAAEEVVEEPVLVSTSGDEVAEASSDEGEESSEEPSPEEPSLEDPAEVAAESSADDEPEVEKPDEKAAKSNGTKPVILTDQDETGPIPIVR